MADALDERSDSFASTASWIAWVIWVVAFLATLLPRPLSLTSLRFTGPLAIVAAGWAVFVVGATWQAALGLVAATVTAVIGFTAWVADDCVNGASYGDEQRFLLRAPGALLAGPAEVAWIAGAAALLTGPLLIAADSLVIGVVTTIVGLPVFLIAFRSLHALSNRVVVLVPAGLTLADPLTLAEAKLFARDSIVTLGPAPADTDALDLSQQALGLALRLEVTSPAAVSVLETRGRATQAAPTAIVFTPASPAALLAEAGRRDLPTGA